MNKAAYYTLLSEDFPSFLDKYLSLPLLQRLSGVGLLCGTDWTPLYRNKFFYSRLDHSIGVALIIWHFTGNKAQTLAGLLHDVSTPAFSHVTDFRNGDALAQESTEEGNIRMIESDTALEQYLAEDGLSIGQVADYHKYPIADNEIPRLSADRLEYMFPTGMILDDSWDLATISRAYDDIVLCQNEDGLPELGFKTVSVASDYCRRCCRVGLIFQRNENKISLQLMAEILNRAILCGIITEEDCFKMSEKQLIKRFEAIASSVFPCIREKNISFNSFDNAKTASPSDLYDFVRCFNTFRTMKNIQRSEEPQEQCFCVSLDVKKRYINPLVVSGIPNTILSGYENKFDRTIISGLYPAVRVTDVSEPAYGYVRDFLTFEDTKYGCVRYNSANYDE